MNNKRAIDNPYLPGLFLLIVAILIGLCTYQHYGISWDEPIQREMGQTSYRYVFENDNTLLTYLERDHGVGFELPLIMLEKVMDLPDISDVYLMRHLVTHLFFLLSVFCGYILVLNLFGKKWLASLAFLMLAFNPRLYAHSFFNSKDIPFLSMFLVCFMLAEVAFRKRNWYWHLLLGVACGYTTSIRVMSMLLVVSFVFFYVVDLVFAVKNKTSKRAPLQNALVFISACCLSLYISFPFLWPNPIANLVETFQRMAHFRWDGAVLFFGTFIRSTELPWTYIPGYIVITVPMLWIFATTGGILSLIWLFLRSPLQYLGNTRERNFLLYLLCGLGPVLMVILLKSVLYDDWRHLYFVYPSLVLLAIYLFYKLLDTRYSFLVPLLCLLQVADTAWFMVRSHPHHQVYFNRLVSHNKEYLRENFDLDYWGASCKQGLDYILSHDTSSAINVYASPIPVLNNTFILNQHDRERIQLVDDEGQAEYYMTNFRPPWQLPDGSSLVHKVVVLNSSILHVYRLER